MKFLKLGLSSQIKIVMFTNNHLFARLFIYHLRMNYDGAMGRITRDTTSNK